MTVRLISVIGSSPGVGKATLCRAVAEWLTDTGASVDHFEEADILTRAAFRPVAEEFADGAAAVQPSTLVECTRAYVAESLAAGKEYLVTDALLPFILSLVAWGHDETTLVGRRSSPPRGRTDPPPPPADSVARSDRGRGESER